MHEFWCGLLLTVALGLDGPRHRGWQIAVAALALAIREFAAPFLGLILLRAVVEKDRRSALTVAIVALGAAGLILLHRDMVLSVTTPADGISQGWLGLGGPAAFASAVSQFTALSALPHWAAALLAFLPILGWATLRRDAAFAAAWFAGFGAVIAVLARADNSYWVVTLLPAYAIGLALVPRFFRDLLGAKRARDPLSPVPAAR
jgi:hypothetical protein